MVGSSRRPLSAEQVTECCEVVLDVARRHRCAFWLLDRPTGLLTSPPALLEWLQLDFFPRAKAVLGAAPRVAVVVAPAEHARWQALRQQWPQDWHPPALRAGWFTTDDRARSWLEQEQAAALSHPHSLRNAVPQRLARAC